MSIFSTPSSEKVRFIPMTQKTQSPRTPKEKGMKPSVYLETSIISSLPASIMEQ